MMLEVRNLAFGYPHKPPLWEHVNLRIEAGEIFSIIGLNGSGKSTLLRCLVGYYEAIAGEMYWYGRKLEGQVRREFLQAVAYVPQLQSQAYSYPVRDYIVMGCNGRHHVFAQPSREDYLRVEQVLEELELTHLREREFNSLSGGEQRGVMIAQAIVKEPQMIILDEPTNHLDYHNQVQVLRLLKRLAAQGTSIMLTSHVPDQVVGLGGRVGILRERTMQVVAAADLADERLLQEIYGVPIHVEYMEKIRRNVCVVDW